MRLVVKKKRKEWKVERCIQVPLHLTLLVFHMLIFEKNQVSGCKQGEARYRT